jgi:pimeloyl-ACP methyl ester carboxylesterase
MSDDRSTIDAAGYPFSTIAWGDPDGRPLLLIHGVTASAEIWWRVAPALAADGYHVVAVDLPGHGRTGHWRGRHALADTAADVVAFVRAAGLDRPDLQVIGHSWGAMVTANLPAAGLHPATIVILDPPSLSLATIGQMANDPTWRTYDTLEAATRAVGAANPTWIEDDVEASARAMMAVDVVAARAIVLDNGDWDAGIGALAAAGPGTDVWLVRGDPEAGGLTLDPAADAYRVRFGADHVITIAGAPHSPQRTHLDATIAAFRQALSPG